MSESYKNWLKQKLEKLQAIECYSAGATPETVAKQLGVTTKQIIKLDFNEVRDIKNLLDLAVILPKYFIIKGFPHIVFHLIF